MGSVFDVGNNENLVLLQVLLSIMSGYIRFAIAISCFVLVKFHHLYETLPGRFVQHTLSLVDRKEIDLPNRPKIIFKIWCIFII